MRDIKKEYKILVGKCERKSPNERQGMVARKYTLQKFCARIRTEFVWSISGPEEFSVNPGMALLVV
jgi:hypothetical protein